MSSALPASLRLIREVSTLNSAFADPDTEAQRQKLNEMILNGRR